MQVYNAGVANLQVNFRSQAAPCDKTLAGWREPFSFDRQFSQALAQSVAIDPQQLGGTQFIAALSKRFPKFWVGAFLRWDTLAGASFVDSPLVTSRDYLSGGFALSWVFGESTQRVEAEQ